MKNVVTKLALAILTLVSFSHMQGANQRAKMRMGTTEVSIPPMNVVHLAAVPFAFVGVLGLIFSGSVGKWAKSDPQSIEEKSIKRWFLNCLDVVA